MNAQSWSTEADRAFKRVGSDLKFSGRIVTVVEDHFEYPDGRIEPREIVRHPGAVGVLAFDDEFVWLTLQPREAVNDPNSLEIPAGRLDKTGEPPLECAKRELAEEIGKRASSWQELKTIFPSVGILEEAVYIYFAWNLSDDSADSGEVERIQLVKWPRSDLDGAIAQVKDSKTLVALMWAKTYGFPAL